VEGGLKTVQRTGATNPEPRRKRRPVTPQRFGSAETEVAVKPRGGTQGAAGTSAEALSSRAMRRTRGYHQPTVVSVGAELKCKDEKPTEMSTRDAAKSG